MKKILILALFFLALIGGTFFILGFKTTGTEGQVVKQSEEEKCQKTNGYIWCAEKGKCIKFGEEDCNIRNFEECERAGFPVIQSIPRKCYIPGGESFLENS